MSNTSYATPTDDQMSWRTADRTHLLPPHLVAFLQSGVSVTIGARSTAGRPVIGAGVACRIRDMAEVRILLSKGANARILEAITAGSAVAATFSSARDHRSIQVKGLRGNIRDTAPDDRSEVARQTAILADELVELGYTRVQADAYAFCDTTDFVSLEFVPERVFTQTPGPGAGAELPR